MSIITMKDDSGGCRRSVAMQPQALLEKKIAFPLQIAKVLNEPSDTCSPYQVTPLPK